MTLTDFTIAEVEGLKSYATLAEAKRYLVVNLLRWPAWMGLSESEQQRLLVAATARLDLLRYVGRKADKAQETQWPRVATGLDDADNVIPPALVHAVSIMAGSLATDPAAGEEPGTVAMRSGLKRMLRRLSSLGRRAVKPCRIARRIGYCRTRGCWAHRRVGSGGFAGHLLTAGIAARSPLAVVQRLGEAVGAKT